MVRGNFWVVKLTHNLRNILSDQGVVAVQYYINIAVKLSLSHKMVVGGMMDLHLGQVIRRNES